MKPLFLAVLLLASTAGAQIQKWEYAIWRSYETSPRLDVWETKNDVSTASSTTTRGLAIALGYKNLPSGTNDLSEIQFLNIVGLDGWELTVLDHNLNVYTYYFKKQIKK